MYCSIIAISNLPTPLLAIAAGASVFFKLSEKIFKEDKNMQGANIYVFVPALVCLVRK